MMNKKRLAALALSAVMVASTMSIPVNASAFSDGTAAVADTFSSETAGQALDVTEEVPEDAGNTSDAYEVAKETIKFHYKEEGFEDFTVTYQMRNLNDNTLSEVQTAKASVLEETDPTCTEPGYLWMVVKLYGVEYPSGETDDKTTAFVTEPKLGHKMEEVRRQTIESPTHLKPGTAHVWEKCSVCGYEEDKDIVLDPQEHTWGEMVYEAKPGNNIKIDENGKVVFDEDGTPALIDETKDGFYETVYYCTANDGAEKDREEHVVYAKKGVYGVIIEQSGIATQLVSEKKYYSPTTVFPLDEARIELKDCSKEGWYIVEYYTNDNKPISQEKITVAPHHFNTFVTAEFKTADDMAQCNVEYNEDGTLKITNKSCYLPIEYTEVTHCSAAGCPAEDHKIAVGKDKDGNDVYLEQPQLCIKADGKTTDGVIKTEVKTAEPAGDHIIKTSAKEAIKKLVEDGKVRYDELKAIADVKENFVQISARPENNCEQAGKVTVSFICVVDKETVVETMTVDVIATGHTRQPAVRENYVAPTCQAVGSYEAVIYCKTCGKELERRTVKIPRIKHSNELSVTEYGIGTDDTKTDTTAYIKFVGDKVVDTKGETLAYKGKTIERSWVGEYRNDETTEFGLYAGVYTNCTMCNEHEVRLDESLQKNIKLTIVDIEKQKESGEAGFVTVKAEYTKADGKTVVTGETTVPYFTSIEAYMGRVESAPLNGLHQDKDGVWRYYKDDVFQADYTGFVEYAGRTFYVSLGTLEKVTDLIIYENEWYYLVESELVNYNGVVLYDGKWFYVTNGRLDTTVNGIVPYDGAYFVFVEGRLADEGNGLWINDKDEAYWLADGRVCMEYTGVAMYDNAFFYIVDGKLAKDFNGTVEYDGATFRVENGQLYGPIK